MSLQVYNKTDPPMSVIVDNDTYFDGHTELDSGDTRREKSLALTGLNFKEGFQLLISLRILITFHLILSSSDNTQLSRESI